MYEKYTIYMKKKLEKRRNGKQKRKNFLSMFLSFCSLSTPLISTSSEPRDFDAGEKISELETFVELRTPQGNKTQDTKVNISSYKNSGKSTISWKVSAEDNPEKWPERGFPTRLNHQAYTNFLLIPESVKLGEMKQWRYNITPDKSEWQSLVSLDESIGQEKMQKIGEFSLKGIFELPGAAIGSFAGPAGGFVGGEITGKLPDFIKERTNEQTQNKYEKLTKKLEEETGKGYTWLAIPNYVHKESLTNFLFDRSSETQRIYQLKIEETSPEKIDEIFLLTSPNFSCGRANGQLPISHENIFYIKNPPLKSILLDNKSFVYTEKNVFGNQKNPRKATKKELQELPFIEDAMMARYKFRDNENINQLIFEVEDGKNPNTVANSLESIISPEFGWKHQYFTGDKIVFFLSKDIYVRSELKESLPEWKKSIEYLNKRSFSDIKQNLNGIWLAQDKNLKKRTGFFKLILSPLIGINTQGLDNDSLDFTFLSIEEEEAQRILDSEISVERDIVKCCG